jgi:hypothetical protein
LTIKPSRYGLISSAGLRFLRQLLTALPGLFTAEFPNDAALAELAVEAGVGAGPASVQALLAVADLHFLADHAGVPVRVVAAFVHVFHKNIIAKVLTLNQSEIEIENHFRGLSPSFKNPPCPPFSKGGIKVPLCKRGI